MKTKFTRTLIQGGLGCFLLASSSVYAVPSATQLVFQPGSDTPNVTSQVQTLNGRLTLTSGDNEIREVILSDGSVFVLSPGAEVELTLDSDDKLALNLIQGNVRVTTGRQYQDIQVNAANTSANVNEASGVFEANGSGLTTALVYGQAIEIQTGGEATSLVKPGFSVTVSPTSSSSERPTRMSQDGLVALVTPQGALGNSNSGDDVDVQDNTVNAPSDGLLIAAATEDQALPAIDDTPEPIADPVVPDPDPEPPFIIPGRPGEVADNSDSVGFGPGVTIDAPEIYDTQASQSDGDEGELTQIADSGEDGLAYITPSYRDRGRTTNRLFNLGEGDNQVLGNNYPIAISDRSRGYGIPIEPDNELAYLFSDESGLSFYVDGVNTLYDGQFSDISAPVLFTRIRMPENGSVFSRGVETVTENEFVGQGGPFELATDYSLLVTGINTISGEGYNDYSRDADNFIFLEARPAIESATITTYDEIQITHVLSEDGTIENHRQFLDNINFYYFELDESDLSETEVNQLAELILGTPLENITEQAILDLGIFDSPSIASFLVDNLNNPAIVSDPARGEHYFFAAGDVDGRLADDFAGTNFSVDHFEMGTGIASCGQDATCTATLAGTSNDGVRSFARSETALGMELTDTGLLVINPNSETGDAQNALLHVDFGYQGEGGAQDSTISATIGQVTYSTALFDHSVCESNECVENSIEVSLEGQTLGSSRGVISSGESEARSTVSFNSPIRATAAGGGNPALDRQGYAGYLVLENYDPEPQFENETPLNGGTEAAIGDSLGESASNVDYAMLRLGIATVSENSETLTRSDVMMSGWAAGLGTRETLSDGQSSSSVTQVDTDLDPGNFTLATNADTNRVQATFDFYNQDAVQLGGLNGEETKGASAFVDDDRFAARTDDNNADANFAMVSGDLVKSGLPEEVQALIPEYEHVKWGFFFGDIAQSDAQREHVHLGSWVAGELADPANFPTTGSATYTGHAIGNVYSAGDSYNAVGSYSNTWDFGSRRGTVAMDFDNVNYTGETRLRDNSITFDGVLEATGREGAVHGNFIQSESDPAAAVAGRFAVQNTEGDDYRASGTFAGEK